MVQIKQANEKAALERKLKDQAKEAKEKAEGTYRPPVERLDESQSWSKGSAMHEQTQNDSSRRPPRQEESGFLSRSNMGSEKPVAEDKKPFEKRPPRTTAPDDKESFVFRNKPAEKTAAPEEEKKAPSALGKSSGRPGFT